MITLYIIRGPSGSGKSTIARHLGGIARHNWFEADMYFVGPNGSYQFNASNLGQAHAWCQSEVETAMRNAERFIVVSNTTMTLKELKPYLDLARLHDYATEIIRSPGNWSKLGRNMDYEVEILTKRNIHNVATDVVRRQINKYQPHPDEISWCNMEIFDASHQ